VTSVGVLAHSAKTLGGGLEELRKTLATYGINDPMWHEVPKSRFVPDQVKELLKEDVELIFVWGGDGTVQRVIDAVAGVPVALAILPAGTANLFATNLGIPKDLEEAVKRLVHKHCGQEAVPRELRTKVLVRIQAVRAELEVSEAGAE